MRDLSSSVRAGCRSVSSPLFEKRNKGLCSTEKKNRGLRTDGCSSAVPPNTSSEKKGARCREAKPPASAVPLLLCSSGEKGKMASRGLRAESLREPSPLFHKEEESLLARTTDRWNQTPPLRRRDLEEPPPLITAFPLPFSSRAVWESRRHRCPAAMVKSASSLRRWRGKRGWPIAEGFRS
ncbi:unnamed protein product [Musa acuminata subsp. burmannicoides]